MWKTLRPSYQDACVLWVSHSGFCPLSCVASWSWREVELGVNGQTTVIPEACTGTGFAYWRAHLLVLRARMLQRMTLQ